MTIFMRSRKELELERIHLGAEWHKYRLDGRQAENGPNALAYHGACGRAGEATAETVAAAAQHRPGT